MKNEWRIHVACLDARFAGIEMQARNMYSQFGEDGLVQFAFERIGLRNRWCFEVGAADGEYLSNTRSFREQGWHCLLVESNKEQFRKLALLQSGTVFCINECIDGNSLDGLLADCGAPSDMDFGCIDIDGQDYWAWEGMKNYSPRVILVEFCPNDGHGIPRLGDTTGQQASLGPIVELGKEKGYTAVAKTYVNALFVKDTELA